MVRICVFQEFTYDGRLEEWLVVVLKGRDETARVEVEEGLGLVVRVDLDILVRYLLLFEDGPSPLDERAAIFVNRCLVVMMAVDRYATYNQPEYNFSGSSF